MGEPSHDARTLAPIILRLREIERKCAAMGARNEEFPLMQARVASLIEHLERAASSGDRPASFAALARQLFAVAHLFESVGFISVGREIAHIERSLQELDGDAGPAPAARPTTVSPAASPTTAPRPESERDEDASPQQPDRSAPRPQVPLPVVIAFLLLVAAIAAAVSVVVGVGPVAALLGRQVSEPPPAADNSTVVQVPAPAPSPTPSPSPAPAPTTTVVSGAKLAEAVAQARLALARRDPEAAYERLVEAARIDRSDEDVVEIAGRLLELAVRDAESAAAAADWEAASEHITRADRLAMRFGLGERAIRDVERRIAGMERFRWLEPDDRAALERGVGRRIEVHLRGGVVVQGVLEGVSGSLLHLAMVREVSGGGMSYTEDLPLSEIHRVKVFED